MNCFRFGQLFSFFDFEFSWKNLLFPAYISLSGPIFEPRALPRGTLLGAIFEPRGTPRGAELKKYAVE